MLELKCNLLLSEEGAHPDGIYVDRGENDIYWRLPQFVELLRESFSVDVSDTSACDAIRGLRITIEQKI